MAENCLNPRVHSARHNSDTWPGRRIFQNQLHALLPSHHRVTATYFAPNGQILGTVEDGKEVSDKTEKVTFTARIGNASGGAFLPGEYRVDFYVNGYPLSSGKFNVMDDRDLAYILNSHQGSILGLGPEREALLEVHFQPHSNGALRGRLVIHARGFGAASLEGTTQGNQIELPVRLVIVIIISRAGVKKIGSAELIVSGRPKM